MIGNSTARTLGPTIGLTMSDPIARKAADVAVLKRRGNPAMRAGAPSLNPRGRPKTGHSLAEAIRSHFSPETIIEMLEQLTRSDDDRVRLVAVQTICDRGYGKALTTEAMDAQLRPSLPMNWADLPPAERGVFLEALRMRAALPSEGA